MESQPGALSVDLFVMVATLVYVVVGWIVGLRLLLLARRTRGVPELTLGLGECLLAGAVPPFFVLMNVLQEPAWLMRAASFGGHLTYTAGCVAMIVFTWRVFRPEAGWARALALLMIATMVLAGGLGMGRAFVAAEVAMLKEHRTPAFLLMEFASVGLFLWASAEAFHHYGRLRRQAAIGLADPELVNRMLLWAGLAVGGVTAAGVSVAGAFLGLHPLEHAPTRIVCSLGTLGSSICAQLAFLPPQGYLRWVRGRSAAQSA